MRKEIGLPSAHLISTLSAWGVALMGPFTLWGFRDAGKLKSGLFAGKLPWVPIQTQPLMTNLSVTVAGATRPTPAPAPKSYKWHVMGYEGWPRITFFPQLISYSLELDIQNWSQVSIHTMATGPVSTCLSSPFMLYCCTARSISTTEGSQKYKALKDSLIPATPRPILNPPLISGICPVGGWKAKCWGRKTRPPSWPETRTRIPHCWGCHREGQGSNCEGFNNQVQNI